MVKAYDGFGKDLPRGKLARLMHWLCAPDGLKTLAWLLTVFGTVALAILLALGVLTLSAWGQAQSSAIVAGSSTTATDKRQTDSRTVPIEPCRKPVNPTTTTITRPPAISIVQNGCGCCANAADNSSGNQKSAADARDEIKDLEARHDTLFKWILTLVGLYTIFIGTFTLVAGLFSYVNVEALKQRTLEQAAELNKSSDELQQEIRDQLPEVSNLKARLRELLMELDQLIPGEEDWAGGPESSPARRQKVIISEATINGLRIFLNPDAVETRKTMIRLYRKLALFYFREAGRPPGADARGAAEVAEAAAERADVYLGMAIELDPNTAEPYRIRGAIALSRYKQLTAGGTPQDEAVRLEAERLFERAVSNLKASLRLDPASLGAAYNLALANYYGHDVAAAIDVSTEALRHLQQTLKTSPTAVLGGDVRKYVPFLYLNAVCFLAVRAGREEGNDRNASYEDALRILREGVKTLDTPEFRSAQGALRSGVEGEIRAGDLTETPEQFRARAMKTFAKASESAAKPADAPPT